MLSLRGKVVLVDFWTYTCINCIRTLPFVTSWYDKYKDDGFVVIGVHSPEFEFEKNTPNVEGAIKRFGIRYPVPQDNNLATWNAFSNQYWPAEYLIDSRGIIRRTHFGEGEYDQMEKAIQTLLKEAGAKNVTSQTVSMPDQTPQDRSMSQETYLGASRMEFLFPDGRVSTGKQVFAPEVNPENNTFTFGGEWTINGENAVSGKGAVITYNFTAQKVFLVMKPPPNAKGKVKLFIDGRLIKVAQVGDDVSNGEILVDSDRLYNLVSLSGFETHLLRLEFETPGTSVYAFTFG